MTDKIEEMTKAEFIEVYKDTDVKFESLCKKYFLF